MAVDSCFGGILNETKSNDSWAFVFCIQCVYFF